MEIFLKKVLTTFFRFGNITEHGAESGVRDL